MKAVVYNKKGKPERLIYCETGKPVPGDNEVLIRIHAASANAADYRSMAMGLIPKRKIFGADIAGVVESVGTDVRLFKRGDEVMGDLASYGFGGFAEYVTAPERALAIKPAGISFEEAATLSLAAMTALQALRNKGKICKGENVLIVGSAGGVGTFAIQLAKYFGAIVTGVCSSKNVEQTRILGADYVIDYTKEDFTESKKRYDLIIAINGNHSLRSYKRLLARNGRYVMVGGSLKQIFSSLLFGWIFSFGSRKMGTLAAKANKNDLEFIARIAADGIIKPVIDRTYPLEKTAEAIRYISSGHARGKVVISCIQA
jgi:NADPH:quinone reductase-like Zn-dependent oxidoreductase